MQALVPVSFFPLETVSPPHDLRFDRSLLTSEVSVDSIPVLLLTLHSHSGTISAFLIQLPTTHVGLSLPNRSMNPPRK